MSCQICGSSACAKWMHSATEQEAFDSLENMDERQLKREVMSLRDEVRTLQDEIMELQERMDE